MNAVEVKSTSTLNRPVFDVSRRLNKTHWLHKFPHALCKVEDDGHDFVRRQEVFCVEGVDDAAFGMAERSVAWYTTQHEHTKAVKVDSSYAINQ